MIWVNYRVVGSKHSLVFSLPFSYFGAYQSSNPGLSGVEFDEAAPVLEHREHRRGPNREMLGA